MSLTEESKGMKNTLPLSPQLTQPGSSSSRGVVQGLSTFCYLGYCIYPSTGWLRELLLQIYSGWPGFIHGQVWNKAICWGVAHPEGLLEALLKGAADSHDLQGRAHPHEGQWGKPGTEWHGGDNHSHKDRHTERWQPWDSSLRQSCWL